MKRWVLLALLLASSVRADEVASEKPVAPKPYNRASTRKIQSTITAVDRAANAVKMTLKNDVVTVGFKPTTELEQEERGLVAADLRTGDTLCELELKGKGIKTKGKIEGRATVQTTTPLVLLFDDLGSITVSKTEVARFTRTAAMTPEQLNAGQTVEITMTVQKNGEVEARRIAVIVEKPAPPKVIKPRKPRKPRAQRKTAAK